MARLRGESSRSYSGRSVLSGTAVTPGTAIREGRCGSTGVSRGHSTGSHEPVNTPEGLTTREGLNLAGRHDHRWSCPGALTPTGRATGSDHRGRERVAALSVRTARNRRTRTRMSGGVGGGGRNPPADPIRRFDYHGCHEVPYPMSATWLPTGASSGDRSSNTSLPGGSPLAASEIPDILANVSTTAPSGRVIRTRRRLFE